MPLRQHHARATTPERKISGTKWRYLLLGVAYSTADRWLLLPQCARQTRSARSNKEEIMATHMSTEPWWPRFPAQETHEAIPVALWPLRTPTLPLPFAVALPFAPAAGTSVLMDRLADELLCGLSLSSSCFSSPFAGWPSPGMPKGWPSCVGSAFCRKKKRKVLREYERHSISA